MKINVKTRKGTQKNDELVFHYKRKTHHKTRKKLVKDNAHEEREEARRSSAGEARSAQNSNSKTIGIINTTTK